MKKNPSSKHKQQAKSQNEGIREITTYLPQQFALPKGYSATPSQQQIFYNHGKCTHLTIRSQYGTVQWTNPVDISTIKLSLKEVVRFAHRELEVYQSNCATPKIGQELNQPCFATFFTAEHPKHTNLLNLCKINGCQLVRTQKNAFTVFIPHFTKYNFNDSQESQKKSKNRSESNRQQSIHSHSSSLPINSTSSQQNNSNSNNSNPQNVSNIIAQQFLSFTVKSDRNSSSENSFNNLSRNLFHRQIQQQKQQNLQIIPQQSTNKMQIQQQNNRNIKSQIFQKLCNFIESDKIYYNKDVTTKSLLPQQLLSLQNKYRKRCNLPLVKEPSFRIPQSFIAHGCIVKAKRYQCDSQPYYQILTIKNPTFLQQPQNKSQHSFFGLITQDQDFTPQAIGHICNNQAYPFPVRRILSLYSILFQDTVYLQFNSQYKIKLLFRGKANTGQYKIQLFKNWISWVTNHSYPQKLHNNELFLHNNKINQALTLRKPHQAISFLYVNNRWEDADFITNIEDNAFRTYYKKTRKNTLGPQLQSIFLQQIEGLEKGIFDWFLLMAFIVWYFKANTAIDNLSAVIDAIPAYNVKGFHQQYRMIQLFLVKNGKKVKESLLCPSNQCLTPQKLCCFYLMSNNLGLAGLEQQIICKSEDKDKKRYRYGSYRYRLITKIGTLYSKQESIINLVRNDKFLKNNEKESIIKKIGQITGTADQQITKLQVEANCLINEGIIIQALKKLFQINKWNDSIFEKVCKLATLPKILINFKKSVNESVREILQQRKQLFSDILIILAMNLKEDLSNHQFSRLFEILQGKSRFSIYITPSIRTYLLNSLQDYIIKAIVLRNSFFELITSNTDIRNGIQEFFKERVEVFKKMEEVISKM